MIEEKRAAHSARSDVLSLLIRAQSEGAPITDGDLVGQATVLFGASYETITNALTWTLFLLAQHPRVLADLLDELAGILHGGPPMSEQLDHLPLLKAVIKESMRILPPVHLVRFN